MLLKTEMICESSVKCFVLLIFCVIIAVWLVTGLCVTVFCETFWMYITRGENQKGVSDIFGEMEIYTLPSKSLEMP